MLNEYVRVEGAWCCCRQVSDLAKGQRREKITRLAFSHSQFFFKMTPRPPTALDGSVVGRSLQCALCSRRRNAFYCPRCTNDLLQQRRTMLAALQADVAVLRKKTEFALNVRNSRFWCSV